MGRRKFPPESAEGLLSSFLQKQAGAISARGTTLSLALQSWKKPFNPLLGETWQARQAHGGCTIFMEQISHHPPISAFEMLGPSAPFDATFLPFSYRMHDGDKILG